MKRQSRKTKETERDRRGWFIENNVETGWVWASREHSSPTRHDGETERERNRDVAKSWTRKSDTRNQSKCFKVRKKRRGRPGRPANRWMIDEMRGKQRREKKLQKKEKKRGQRAEKRGGIRGRKEGEGRRSYRSERKKWQKGKERSQGRQKWDKILVTQIDEGARKRKKRRKQLF